MDINEKYSPDYEWYDSSFDWFTEIGAAIGFDITDIYFSGFWSQGDGASFVGSLAYRKGWKAALSETCTDETVQAIASRWAELQRRNFYSLNCSVTRGYGSNHYSHENTVTVDCEDSRDSYRTLPDGSEEEATDIARDFMRWIYRQLETEYEYQRAWQFANGWKDLATEMTDTRRDARALVADMRAAIKAGINAAPSICSALRSQLRTLLGHWEELRDERDQLADNFHYWQDGKSISIEQFATANL